LKYLFILLLIVGCSKETFPSAALTFNAEGKHIDFPAISFTATPFCNRQLYSIVAGDDLLISIVADSLVKGSYPAGLTWWGNWSEDIVFTVISNHNSTLSASFTGPRCSGRIYTVI
jgi:hypothetical protein